MNCDRQRSSFSRTGARDMQTHVRRALKPDKNPQFFFQSKALKRVDLQFNSGRKITILISWPEPETKPVIINTKTCIKNLPLSVMW